MTQKLPDRISHYLNPNERHHTMNNSTTRRRVAVAALAVVITLIAILLTGCATGPKDGPLAECDEMSEYAAPPGGLELVAVLDGTGSARDASWLGEGFDSVVTEAAGVYGRLSVLWVGGAGETPTWAIDGVALNDSEHEFDTLHYNEAVDRAASCVESMIGTPTTTQPGTDLGTAIQVAADRLASATGPKRLLVVSDGLSNSGPVDLTGVIGTTAVDASLAKLTSTGFAPGLADTEVTFSGLGVRAGSITPPASVTWLRNFYLGVCTAALAASCEAPVADQGATADGTAPRADAPEDPDLGLSDVEFEFSESEVRFALDSADITAESDAALGQVAACLRDGSTLTVIGHADNTGGDPTRNQELSALRAQTVADRVLSLAGHPTVTVVAFGVGSSEPKTATGDQPEDRRVAVSLSGMCS